VVAAVILLLLANVAAGVGAVRRRS
jgi:hypothetical protein